MPLVPVLMFSEDRCNKSMIKLGVGVILDLGVTLDFVIYWHNDSMILYARLRCWITSKYSDILF